MTDYEMHEPEFSGTTSEEWDNPRLEDFQTDDLSEVDDHFLPSESGFPLENFTDLKLPVVEPSVELNRSALRTVESGGRGVGAVEDLDDGTADEVEDLIDELANDHFEGTDFGERLRRDDETTIRRDDETTIRWSGGAGFEVDRRDGDVGTHHSVRSRVFSR